MGINIPTREEILVNMLDDEGFDGVMALILERAKELSALPAGNPARKQLRLDRIRILTTAYNELYAQEHPK